MPLNPYFEAYCPISDACSSIFLLCSYHISYATIAILCCLSLYKIMNQQSAVFTVCQLLRFHCYQNITFMVHAKIFMSSMWNCESCLLLSYCLSHGCCCSDRLCNSLHISPTMCTVERCNYTPIDRPSPICESVVSEIY